MATKTKSKPIGIIPKISVVPFLSKRSNSDHHSDDEDGSLDDSSQRPDGMNILIDIMTKIVNNNNYQFHSNNID